MSRSEVVAAPRHSTWVLIAFSSPAVAATLLISPVFGILPSYYALHTGVTLSQIGAGFLIARVADALTDPMVGILSDRTRSRLGPRIPWMIAGGALAAPSIYFLFLPPPTASAMYFFVWSFIVMTAWTLLTIPHGAWAAELTDDYDARSRVFGIRNVLANLGGLSFFLLPPLLAPLTGTTEIDESTMWALVIALWILIPLSLLWAAWKAPVPNSASHNSALAPASIMSIVRSITANKPFLSFVVITTMGGISAGMSTALLFLFVQDYMQLGPHFYLIGVLSSVASVASTPIWIWASRRWNKHRAWAAGLLLGGVVWLPIMALDPGPGALVPLLVINVLAGVMQGVIIPLPASVLADIADYEAWKQNTKATGNYFSLLILLSKVTAAVGSAAALFLSDFLGYVPQGTDSSNALSLLIPLVVVPSTLHFAAAVLVWRFPLDRRHQAIITRRLAQRQERTARATCRLPS